MNMSENFDYKTFAQSMKEQCAEFVPDEFGQENKKFLTDTVYNFSFMAGEALCNDTSINLDKELKIFVTQIIAEWIFHKSCDLIRADIPQEYREDILKQIAFGIFEVAKQACLKGISQEKLVDLVEYHVNISYKTALETLCEQNAISQKDVENALSFSNIDKMTEQIAKEHKFINDAQPAKPKQTLKTSFLKFCSNIKIKTKELIEKFRKTVTSFIPDFFIQLSLLLVIIITALFLTKPPVNVVTAAIWCSLGTTLTIIAYFVLCNFFIETENKFHQKINKLFSRLGMIAIFILLSVTIYSKAAGIVFAIPFLVLLLINTIAGVYISIIWTTINIQETLSELDRQREDMENLANPDTMYERLGVDIIELQVGEGLLPIADPDQEGQLLPKTAALRQQLTDELGYILPSIRIRDFEKLDNNEYTIIVRGTEAGSGFVYPGRYMVIADDWEKKCDFIPEDAIISVTPIDNIQCFWLNEKDLEKIPNIKATAPVDIMLKHLEYVAIKYIDSILTTTDIIKYLELSEPASGYVIGSLRERLYVEDIRKIFVNLIKEHVPVKDVLLIFDRLADFARFTTEVDELSERMRTVLARNICFDNCTIDKVMYAVTINEYFEKRFSKSIVKSEQYTEFNLNPALTEEFIQQTNFTLMKAKHDTGKQPVILCSAKIRLPLYRFLCEYFTKIIVISYDELISDIKIENVGQIGNDTQII